VSTGPYGPESPANSNILADQLVARAEIYIRAKRYDEAVADAQRVITAPNVAADAYYLLSVAERALGRTPMADSDLARAKTLWSDVEDVYSKKLNP
jgi:tetratricopeptide (TPR) repeat protein